MAEPGLRKQVENPLALHPKENLPARQLGLQGVQNPMQTAGRGDADRMNQFFGALDGLRTGLATLAAEKSERDITEGKIAYMSGATEDEMSRTGNRYTMQGWQSLNAVDRANNLYMQELADMENSAHLTPEEYQKRLMAQRADALNNLPEDPVIRKMFAAAFEDMGPRAASAHAQQHMQWNERETDREFRNVLRSGSVSNADTPRTRIPGSSSLKLSDAVVSTPYAGTDEDRHIGILTMLGEAGAEGDLGMASVAHVLKNRAGDKRWGGSIKNVALAPKQFSTWNAGAGGNNPAGRYKPGTPIYERAARVYDAVMSGRHVDPTGGATHFYSPRGMQKLVDDGHQSNTLPRWLQNESKKSGGSIQIGNHIFVGRAGGARAPAGAPDTNTTESASGSDLVVNDAVERRPLDPIGVDVTVAETEEEVLAAEAAMNAPQALSDEAFGERFGIAPQEVADAQEIPVSEPTGPSTQIQELLRGFTGVSREKRVAALSEEIVLQLEDGESALYDSVGGEAFLIEMGASPQAISAVRRAKNNYDKSEGDKFSVERERALASIQEKADRGDASAIDDIVRMHENDELDDRAASNLYRAAANALSKAGDNRWRDNPEAQSAITAAYQFMKDGGDLVQSMAAVREIGEKYGLPENEVLSMMDTMRRLQEQRMDSERTELARRQKEYEANATVIGDVKQALSNGYGLKGINGQVKIPDGAGNTKSVSAQQYGVAMLQQSEYGNAKAMLEADQGVGNLDQDQVVAVADANIYGTLRKHDVVDTERAQYMTGSLTGNIIGPDGKVTADAVKSFEFYMRMSENPTIGDKYMSQYLSDDGARALVHTARGYYAGNYNLEDSLRRAHQTLNDPNVDVQRKMANDGMFSRPVSEHIDKVLDSQFGSGILSVILGDAGFAASDMQFVRAEAKRTDSPIRREITRAAQAHYMAMPRISPENAVKMAMETVGNNIDIVAGNMVIGNARQNKKLSQVMGVADMGARATQDAIDQMLLESGEELFGELFKTQARGTALGSALTRIGHGLTFGAFSGDGLNYRSRQTRYIPDYNVMYDSNTGQVGIQLYQAPDEVRGVGEREIPTGPTHWFDAAAIGARYRETQKGGILNSIGNTFTSGVREIMEKARPKLSEETLESIRPK